MMSLGLTALGLDVGASLWPPAPVTWHPRPRQHEGTLGISPAICKPDASGMGFGSDPLMPRMLGVICRHSVAGNRLQWLK